MIFHDLIGITLGFVFGAPIGMLMLARWWFKSLGGAHQHEARKKFREALDAADRECDCDNPNEHGR